MGRSVGVWQVSEDRPRRTRRPPPLHPGGPAMSALDELRNKRREDMTALEICILNKAGSQMRAWGTDAAAREAADELASLRSRLAQLEGVEAERDRMREALKEAETMATMLENESEFDAVYLS